MTKIEWTDRTWNPTTGCNKVSPGCKNCYAEKMHKRMQGIEAARVSNSPPSQGGAGGGSLKYTKPFLAGVQMHEDELTKPLHWKKPQRIFVNSMSDLFHEDVPFEFIENVFQVMAECSHHTFQILTKRPDKMMRVLNEMIWSTPDNILPFLCGICCFGDLNK